LGDLERGDERGGCEVLSEQLADISGRMDQEKWLTRAQLKGVQQQLRQAFDALPVPTSRLDLLVTAGICGGSAGLVKRYRDWPGET
jgi:hypothetical protein